MNNIFEELKENYNTKNFNLSAISGSDATFLLQKLATKFSFNLNTLFLWEVGLNNKQIIPYQSENWQELLEGQIKKLKPHFFLVITDENFFPWEVLVCNRHIINALRNCRFFEYFLFDDFMERIIFDTHNNSLIIFSEN